MDLKTLLSATPETLAATQFTALKQHALSVLRNAAELIEAGEFTKVPTFYSAAGDDHGDDNECLDFSLPGDEKNDADIQDIGDVTARLIKLESIAKGVKR